MSRRRPQRRARNRPPGGDPAALLGAERVELHPDGAWHVRRVTGSAATKPYRCPGCQQQVAPATPHVVAWPQLPSDFGAADGLAERRHWHTGCWQARDRCR